jgi:hypothetical protein
MGIYVKIDIISHFVHMVRVLNVSCSLKLGFKWHKIQPLCLYLAKNIVVIRIDTRWLSQIT